MSTSLTHPVGSKPRASPIIAARTFSIQPASTTVSHPKNQDKRMNWHASCICMKIASELSQPTISWMLMIPPTPTFLMSCTSFLRDDPSAYWDELVKLRRPTPTLVSTTHYCGNHSQARSLGIHRFVLICCHRPCSFDKPGDGWQPTPGPTLLMRFKFADQSSITRQLSNGALTWGSCAGTTGRSARRDHPQIL